MNVELLTAPLIGAVIGYITNDIAIRMLFHPYRPLYIGKFKLPFTPGIIPKEQARIAKSLGQVVSEMLLCEEALKQALISDEVIKNFELYIDEGIERYKLNEHTISEELNRVIPVETTEEIKRGIVDKATLAIEKYVLEKNIGEVAAEALSNQIKEQSNGKLATLLLPLFEGNIKVFIKNTVNDFLNNNIRAYSSEIIKNTIVDIENKKVCELAKENDAGIQELKAHIVYAYKTVVETKLKDILLSLKIDKIVENKIMTFKASELEDLIFGIMKKELKSVVNLGAVLGMLIGFVNAFI